MQYDEFLRKRLTQLRLSKGVSARDMSLSLGQSESYINKIENGRTLPSMEGFFYICDYFGLRPQDFFSEQTGNLTDLDTLVHQLSTLDSEVISALRTILNQLAK